MKPIGPSGRTCAGDHHGFGSELGRQEVERAGHATASGVSEASALVGGYRLAFLIAAGFVLVALAIGAALLRTGGRPAEGAGPERASAPDPKVR
ncbi:hypothetical protein [Streptomyces sp. NPDC046805]|uniref:hypothetical protein n=1 Tax=Streptomyces sp. NPDC046805 TaxID=3155134 RepID=UPI0033CA03C5